MWKLNEISITVHVPLADPDLLKALTENMKARPTSANASVTPHTQATTSARRKRCAGGRGHADDSYGGGHLREQLSQSRLHLHAFESGWLRRRRTERASGDADQQRTGQREAVRLRVHAFRLWRTPATSFHLSAAPNANTFGRKTFCADQSGMIRSSEDGNPAACFTAGLPVQ